MPDDLLGFAIAVVGIVGLAVSRPVWLAVVAVVAVVAGAALMVKDHT